MPFVKSRVNNLLVAIPNDVRGVMHRFAVSGGGNELVFDPIKKSDFQRSQRQDSEPLTIGGRAEPKPLERVALSTNVADDDEPAASAEPRVVDTPEDEGEDVIYSPPQEPGPTGPEAAPTPVEPPAAPKPRASRRRKAVAVADIPQAAQAASEDLY